ncbi:MAG: FAD-binding protein [Treponema sp.]|jgi:succinate dehydrogenase/fumarate reductase flavoprotein subunit|nr:FAD-binding protein [Treponema sp.]
MKQFLGLEVFMEAAAPDLAGLPGGFHVFDCLIIGSGAAGYNAALHLLDKGVENTALVTENRLAGTSRNTGSDKQTYYKTACAGDQKDSPRAVAETLFAGASMDGDLALCEAGHSLQEFFHLVSLGVDFPHNRYGEFTGYKTDHDPLQRASSIGPYTSKKMTERLEAEALRRGLKIIDRARAVKLLADKIHGRVYGVFCLEERKRFRVFFAKNIIFAAGGDPGMYRSTVYPPSQFGASGLMAREGVRFANMTEWQYGIASVQFRWNLSGSYQQVIPRYVAVDEKGKEEEFLCSYFSSIKNLGRAVFLKGYQWPFDPGKIAGEGSSLVDLAIYIEKHLKGKRVYLDFTRNPRGAPGIGFFSPDEIDETARDYLVKSKALGATPAERLLQINPLAYDLYKSHRIDLSKEYLEIDVAPQHHNGGAEVNIWWETSLKHLFAVGECAGTHGVQRPGGSALNAGQVGGYRATSYIAGHYLKGDPFYSEECLRAMASAGLAEFEKDFTSGAGLGGGGEAGPGPDGMTDAGAALARVQELNTRCAAFIRPREEIGACVKEIAGLARRPVRVPDNLTLLFSLKEIILMSRLMYDAIRAFVEGGGKSRGSYLMVDSTGKIEDCLAGVETDTRFQDKVIVSRYIPGEDRVVSEPRPVRPIPGPDSWFEEVWREYRDGAFF